MSTKFYGWTGRHIRVDLTNSDVQVVEDNPGCHEKLSWRPGARH